MSNSRIEKLEKQRAQIDAQLKAARARDKAQRRKDDTRRKIITGALALEHAQRNPDSDFTRTMLRLIQEGVKTNRDRALFDLDPLPQDQAAQPAANHDPKQPTKLWKLITGQ